MKKKVTSNNPLQKLFDLEEEQSTTIVEHEETLPAELSSVESYDEKDDEIEKQLQEVYDVALSQFEIQAGIADEVEGRYAARNAEVAVQFLNTALNAVQTKATVKSNKDKLTKQKGGDGKTVRNNNLVVTDRNEIMRILGQK